MSQRAGEGIGTKLVIEAAREEKIMGEPLPKKKNGDEESQVA